MSIKEKLLQIQQEGEGLTNRIDQKRKLANLKFQVTQSGSAGIVAVNERDRKLSAALVDAGLLDMLSEAVDHIPMVKINIQLKPEEVGFNADFAIFLQWEQEGELGSPTDKSWKELGIFFGSDIITVRSNLFLSPVTSDFSIANRTLRPDDLKITAHYFDDDLKPEQWKDRERLEASIADALWMAGVRPTGG